jgi:hypothetical protein
LKTNKKGVNKLKLNEIIQLDCRIESNKMQLRKALVKVIPSLAAVNPRELEVEDLEIIMKKIGKKYNVGLGYILPGPIAEGHYSFMLKEIKNGKHIGTVFAFSMFEGFAKAAIWLYTREKRREEENES